MKLLLVSRGCVGQHVAVLVSMYPVHGAVLVSMYPVHGAVLVSIQITVT